MSAMTSKGEQMVVPVSMFRRAEMAKSFQVQRIETIEEEMDSGQMRLEAMGYKQELRRKIGFWGVFSLIFSILSVLLGPNTLYIIGLANGGPVVITWGWILVSVMTFMVAASMAEIGSAFPTAGGPYFWAHHLISEHHARWKPIACWVTGWLNLIGQIANTASVTLSCSQLLTIMITMATGGANGIGWIPSRGQQVLIAAGLYVIMALWNTLRVELQAAMSKFSALWTALVAVVIIIALPVIAKQHQSASFVFTSFINNSSGVSSNAYVFLLGLLLPQYQLAGYDAAFHVAEETKNADYTIPVALLTALAASSVLGFLYLVSITFCISDYNHLFDPSTVTGGNFPTAQIMWDAFEQRFDHGGGAVVFLGLIVAAILLSANSLLTSNARMVYAFSRDGAIPGSFLWHRLTANGTPVLAVWLSVGVGMCLILPYVWSVTGYNAAVALATVSQYLAYGCPIVLRTFISHRNFLPGPFHLGWWSFWNGLISCLWIGVITAIFVVPTAYPITADDLNYAGIAVGVWVIIVMTYYFANANRWFTGPMTTLDVDII